MPKSENQKEAWLAALEGKCPRCREGHMFTDSQLNLRKFGKMHDLCESCGLKFEPEPGFFYGAMYVSYAISVAILLVTTFILYFIFGDPALEVYIIAVALTAIILYPINFRYSRIIFLHVFGGIRFDPSYKK